MFQTHLEFLGIFSSKDVVLLFRLIATRLLWSHSSMMTSFRKAPNVLFRSSLKHICIMCVTNLTFFSYCESHAVINCFANVSLFCDCLNFIVSVLFFTQQYMGKEEFEFILYLFRVQVCLAIYSVRLI